MSFIDNRKIYTNPKTPAQLRAILGRLANTKYGDVVTTVEIVLEQGGPVTGTFDSATSAGMALYAPTTGHVDLADCDSAATARVVGIARAGVADGADGEYLTDGRLSLDDWTNVTGGVTLTVGAIYYLSATAGQLTTTAPSSVGQTVVPVGIAITTKVLDLEIMRPGVLL